MSETPDLKVVPHPESIESAAVGDWTPAPGYAYFTGHEPPRNRDRSHLRDATIAARKDGVHE